MARGPALRARWRCGANVFGSHVGRRGRSRPRVRALRRGREEGARMLDMHCLQGRIWGMELSS
eukprot:88155-Pyramimonas_sp.AAC.1